MRMPRMARANPEETILSGQPLHAQARKGLDLDPHRQGSRRGLRSRRSWRGSGIRAAVFANVGRAPSVPAFRPREARSQPPPRLSSARGPPRGTDSQYFDYHRHYYFRSLNEPRRPEQSPPQQLVRPSTARRN